MASTDDSGERKLSRRRFIKWAGGSVVAGTAAVALGGAVGGLLKEKAPSSSPAHQALSGLAPRPPAGSGLLPDNTFSIFWITDTQFLSESNPALYKMLCNWIVSNWAAFNGKMVIHTGDIVQTGAVQQEWVNANDAMSILMANAIPYSWCAGNHDDLVQDDATSGWMGNQWASALNPSVVSSLVNGLPYTHWVGDYHDGMNTAVRFSANGLDFLVVNVEWNAQPDVLKWVGGILDDPAYASHRVIIAPHAYIDAYGSTEDPRWGPTLNDFVSGLGPLMDKHSSNVFLTLNGHFATDCGYNTPAPVNNRNQLMFDRQDCTDNPGDPTGRGVDASTATTSDTDKVGGATVTVLTFDTDNNRIRASTYDIYPGKWRAGPSEEYSVVMFPNDTAVKRPVIAV